MLRNRVIPCLLLSNGGLVKTHRFVKPSYVGDPINAIRIFNEKEVDELVLLDISASREGREPDYALIEEVAGECFMPMAYGGGVCTVDQARRIFDLGVEKICVQTAAISNPEFIASLAAIFGSQSIVVSIDIHKNWLGQYKMYESCRMRNSRLGWKRFLDTAIASGAGEVMINAVDCDGTLAGPDLELIRLASEGIGVPLIAAGGVSSMKDIRDMIASGASAVAAGAFFLFYGPHRAVLITYPPYSELESLLNELQ